MGDQTPHSNQHLSASRHLKKIHESVASSLGAASVFVFTCKPVSSSGAAEIHWRGCSHQGSSAKGRADVSPLGVKGRAFQDVAAQMGRQIRGGGICTWLLRCRYLLPEDARSSATGDAVVVTTF